MANPLLNNGFPFAPPMMSLPPNFPLFQMPQGGEGNSTVPRFPPPPPFIPGMFPPGTPNQNAFMQQWQMSPFMMGRFPFPPTMMFPGQMPPSQPTQPVTNLSPPPQAATTQTPQSQTQPSKPQTSTQSSVVKSQAATACTASPTTSPRVENVGPSSPPQSSESSEDVVSSTSPVTTSQGLENSNQEPQNSSTQTTTASSDASPQQSTNENVPRGQSSTEGLRQRLIGDDETPQRIYVGRVEQNAEIQEPQQRRSGLSASNVLIFFIGLAIAILLIRRFFLSRNWRFYYGV